MQPYPDQSWSAPPPGWPAEWQQHSRSDEQVRRPPDPPSGLPDGQAIESLQYPALRAERATDLDVPDDPAASCGREMQRDEGAALSI